MAIEGEQGSAVIHAASRGRIVVFPANFKIGGPARVVLQKGPVEVLGQAIRMALVDSAAISHDQPREKYEQAMLAVGVSERQIALRRSAHVSENREGVVRVGAWRPKPRQGWEPIPNGVVSLPSFDDGLVGEAVIRALTWDYLTEPILPKTSNDDDLTGGR